MDKQRYVLINGEKVYVTVEVYYAYYRPVWREAKQRNVRADMECSLNALTDSGFEAVSDEAPVDEIVWEKLLSDKLCSVLAELTEDEQILIHALYVEGKSERELSKETNVPHQTIHSRKNAMLKKLKLLLENF